MLSWLVIVAQIVMLTGTASVGVFQPSPQMVREVTQKSELGDWFSDVTTQLATTLQPLWGEPATAAASAIRDTGPHPNGQFLTTVHPEENMVVNGSFEMGPDGANQTNIPGWTVVSGNVDVWNGYFNPDGSYSELDLDGTPGPGTIEQTITGLSAGQSYFFEFSYATNSNTTEQADVFVLDSGGGTILSQTITSTGDANHKGWQSFRQTFTAPADGTATLRFQSLNVNGLPSHGIFIDDVRVAQRLINYVINGSFDAGAQRLNQTEIPGWSLESGMVDIWNGYYNADRSVNEVDLAGSPGPGVITQDVSGLTPGQSYVFEFDYSVNGIAGEQAQAQVLNGGTPLIDQTVTTNGDPNHKGWKHFRQSFTAPAGGTVTLRFVDLSSVIHVYHGVIIDNVRVADAPLNYVINGDFEAAPAALNIANDAIPGWNVTSGPVDNFYPGLLYSKSIDLNGSPGNGAIEQTVTGLQGGQVYAFQFNYQNHASWTTYAYTRLLDSSNTELYEKRVNCKGHVVHHGWCTLRYFFTAPGDGEIKVVFANDETDGNPYYGTNIDNVQIVQDLNFIVNGTFSSGPTGLNQTNVPGWAVSGPTDTHDGFGGEYRFTVEFNGSPGDGVLRQVLTGLTPGQPYTLRYNYASTANNYLVNFDVEVLNADRTSTLFSTSQSTDQLPYVGGWKQAEHTFTAPADGIVQVIFANDETDNNPYYSAIIDNIQVWGQAAVAGTEINVCSNTVILPRPPLAVSPGGVDNGLMHWVRADMDVYSDSGTTAAVDGDSVAQWNDQSGSFLDLSQATTGQRPTYRDGTARSNFNPTLDFTDDFLFNTGRVVQTTDDLTMIAVGDTDVTGGVRTIYASGDNYNDPTMDLDGTWISPWFDGGGTVDVFNTETLSTNQAMIWGMRGINGHANGMHFNYSGEDVPLNMTVTNQPNFGNKIGVGSDAGGEDWDGLIPEAMTYNRNLTTGEMERVYSYLALKYGITMRTSTVANSTGSGNYVSSAGALIWNYDGNSAYHNDVAGIGRDDASGLEQKQSNSVNSDQLVTMALNGVAADNASNGGGFDADQSFLVWGNNDGATTIATSVGVTITRMARIWTVQETAPVATPVGLVTVRVPASTLGLSAGQAAMFIRSDDPIFTIDDMLLFMTCDGSNCEVEVDFTDGDYFTFARAAVAPEISVTPTNITFGDVGESESSPVKTVTINNSGNAPLQLSSVLLTNDGGGQFAGTGTCGAILSPGASCDVELTFTPTATGGQSGVLTVDSSDADEASVTVNLSGTGVVQAPDINVQPTTLTFNDTVLNSASPAQTITIDNTGTGNLTIQNLTLGGTDAAQFIQIGPDGTCGSLPSVLAGGESCTVKVLFSPTSVGAKNATLTVTSNDSDEITVDVALSGNGVTCTGLLNVASLTSGLLEIAPEDNSAAVCVTAANSVTLPVKLFLQGAYDSATDTMRDDLRTLGDFPLTSPYGDGATTTSGVLGVSSTTDAIVDWVLIELRDGGDNTSVVASIGALVQRDGDVVDASDGASTLNINVPVGNYYVAVHHRNHLAAMSTNTVALSGSTALVNFTGMGDAMTFGSNAQVELETGVYGLWAGNVNENDSIIRSSTGNDLDPLVNTVLDAPNNTGNNTNYVVNAYSAGDVNMDGNVIAAGPGNDISPVIVNVISHPANGSGNANYIIQEQLP
ncbi:MAG: choice-of-anchor D domain-containing protein [Caldilineaceae bacterium]